ncbi:MAG: hypothetical protein HC867_01410 [Bacteroidia bacterium]|nr:hypothetical protein [Bacteroidia bacterium]
MKLKKVLTDANLDENSGEKITKLKAQIDKEIYEIEVNANAWTNIRLGWFSGGVAYTKDKYATYDSTRPFEKKIADQLFDKWSVMGTFNFLSKK